MLITLMFSVTAKKSRTFAVSHIQLMSRCAGAGREHSQTARPSWLMKYSISYISCSVYKRGLDREQESFSLVSMTSNPPLSRRLNFSGSLVFRSSAKFTKIHKFRVL